jgi:hypothetical protein
MRYLHLFLLGAVMCLLTITPGQARAEWIENGVSVCDQTDTQEMVRTVSDGDGGAIIAWRDFRNANYDIYAQRIDTHGNRLWAADGVPVCTGAGSQSYFVMIPDGEGGAIMAWNDDRSGGNWDVYAQRIDADGTVLWTTNGVALSAASQHQMYPAIVSDGAGGVMAAWEDYRSGVRWDIYAQRISAAGSVLWTVDGSSIVVENGDQTDLAICEDGYGGFYLAFTDSRNGNWDIYAARVWSNGTPYWGGSGAPLCTDANTQGEAAITSDGLGGFITAWSDNRNGNNDIFAQRISDAGAYMWAMDGIPICVYSLEQYHPVIVTDGSYGAIIAWLDRRSGTHDVYAQRVDVWGSTQWAGNGVPVCTEPSFQDEMVMTSDGEGGAILAWRDYRYSSTYDIYTQRLSGSGNPLWTAGGVPLCMAVGEQMVLECTTDMSNGAIVAFLDTRNGGYDVSAQRIERNGYWGYPAPLIASARDIPGDQGGLLQLSWYASRLDVYPEDHIRNYTIWRAIDELAAMTATERGAVLVEGVEGYIEYEESTGRLMEHSLPLLQHSPEDELKSEIPVIRSELLAGEPYFWELITTVDASDYVDTYAEQIPTLFDSTASSSEYHYFQLIAFESDPTMFWISEVDSGYSVDNLSPCPPAAVMAEQIFTPEGLEITWEPSTEPDLGAYVIHRGMTSDFVPDEGNLVYSECEVVFFDSDWRWDSGYWYKVAAVDVHGNVSEYVVLRPDEVTGEETPETPAASYLSQNFPNPFNPVTRIRFGLREPGRVSLRIYDTAGRLVRVLVEEDRDAGHYTEEWDGRDTTGRTVASGVYFYRVEAGSFEETKKMILLR